jgi:hypothetical protein
MQQHATLVRYLLTLAFYAAAQGAMVWGGFRPELVGAVVIAAAPAVVLGIASTGWRWMGIPLTMWALSSVAFSIVWEFPNDFGRVGVFILTVAVYWPIIIMAFAVGRWVRVNRPRR